ncbi:MAG: LysR family transcriptional regulator [Chromatiales bacterium]|jgi:DNA-binding transcriptional LysR family regulator|nr:LysR family transcriptional regulator [Chromatiales bacterium]MDX9765865.1 LysR family transcriptional regulator [Ectothiorhodospiraceae bacterium]
MDIAQIEAFLAVAETASFSLAAERLHLTQPAVSKRIAALEDELDQRLFDRIGRLVGVTEAGRALLPHARQALDAMRAGRRALEDLAGDVGGTLRFGTSHHIGLHRLPPLLRHYTERYPQVELDIRFMDSEEACRAVEQGTLELAVVTLPQAPSANVITRVVWDDPLVFVAAPDHPAASTRRIEVLAQHPAILPAEGTFTRGIVVQALTAAGVRPQVAMETNYLETIRMMVSIGLGWSVLPRTMLNPELVAVPIRGIALSRALGSVVHRARSLSNAATAMLALLATHTRA